MAHEDADQDAEERNVLALELEEIVRGIALEIGRNLISQAGESAYIGRIIEDKKKKTHYNAPKAYRWFKKNIWKVYPVTKGDEVIEKGDTV